MHTHLHYPLNFPPFSSEHVASLVLLNWRKILMAVLACSVSPHTCPHAITQPHRMQDGFLNAIYCSWKHWKSFSLVGAILWDYFHFVLCTFLHDVYFMTAYDVFTMRMDFHLRGNEGNMHTKVHNDCNFCKKKICSTIRSRRGTHLKVIPFAVSFLIITWLNNQ